MLSCRITQAGLLSTMLGFISHLCLVLMRPGEGWFTKVIMVGSEGRGKRRNAFLLHGPHGGEAEWLMSAQKQKQKIKT